jgi:hypothetical protein
MAGSIARNPACHAAVFRLRVAETIETSGTVREQWYRHRVGTSPHASAHEEVAPVLERAVKMGAEARVAKTEMLWHVRGYTNAAILRVVEEYTCPIRIVLSGLKGEHVRAAGAQDGENLHTFVFRDLPQSRAVHGAVNLLSGCIRSLRAVGVLPDNFGVADEGPGLVATEDVEKFRHAP